MAWRGRRRWKWRALVSRRRFSGKVWALYQSSLSYTMWPEVDVAVLKYG